MNRRDFLLFTNDRKNTAELSCEQLYMRYVDSTLDGSTRQLFESIEQRLSTVKVLRLTESSWLTSDELKPMQPILAAFRARGGRIETQRTKIHKCAILFFVVMAACQQHSADRKVSYPPTKTVSVVEDFFGTKIADPYRWMEDLDSKDVADWVAAQNTVTFAELAALPMRDHFKERITQLWDYPKVNIPRREGGRYFYAKNSGLQRQAPLYMRARLDGEPGLVLDPNVLSPDGSMSLAEWSVSPDGKLLAYGISEGGADWQTLHVREVDTGK